MFIRLIDSEELDTVQFAAFLDRVEVSGTKKDVRLRFILADGSEWEG